MDSQVFVEEDQIKDQAVCYFFSPMQQSSSATPSEALFYLAGPSVTDDQNDSLTIVPTAFEIREAVFHLKKNSSLGSDGFSGVFFTSCWHIVGQDVVVAVIPFFSSGKLLRATNAFYLTLILKK